MLGIDWGDSQHSIALLARDSNRIERIDLKHSAESLHTWLDALKERFGGQPVAVAVEASKGAIVAALLEHPWLLIYPIHPSTSRRFSMAFSPSGAKDDGPDSGTLLEIIRFHRHKLRLIAVNDECSRRLSLLVEARRTMVDRRTLLCNQLTSLLKNYYPQALELTGEKLYAPISLDFLDRWPELRALEHSKPKTLHDFYFKHQVRRPEKVEKRLALIASARALTSDRALCEVSMIELRVLTAEIRLLQKHITHIEETIAQEFASHPDAHLFKSLPGAGAAMAPRLCVLFGTNRNRWSSAQELQTYYGIAPVTERSGNKKWVHWRWNAPVFARQSLVEWAGLSVKFSAWAKAYYKQQEDSQRPHSVIVRSLAFKWLRILFRCWKDRKPYDEAAYLSTLKLRNPTLFNAIQPT
jgi:transposase